VVNVLIIAHSEIANSFAYCIEHILARRIDNLHILPVKKTEDADNITRQAKEFIERIGANQEILILTDIYGATPSNIAHKLIKPRVIELITGLNLPMLIRALSYAKDGLQVCINKTLDGGITGIIHVEGTKNAD
jgi:PTS system ascorbate-specific IIA component